MEQALVNPKWSKERRRELRVKQTPAEELMWEQLRQKRCGGVKFRRQVGIGSYIVDFYCYEGKLAVELDGTIHEDPEIKAYDEARTRYLRSQGIEVLRFTNDGFCGNVAGAKFFILRKIQERLGMAASPSPRRGEGRGEAETVEEE
jgi:very-short-patch-repair endonuclease